MHVTRDAKGIRRIHEIAATTGEVIDHQPELVQLVRWNGTTWIALSTKLPKSHIRNATVDAAALWAAVA